MPIQLNQHGKLKKTKKILYFIEKYASLLLESWRIMDGQTKWQTNKPELKTSSDNEGSACANCLGFFKKIEGEKVKKILEKIQYFRIQE